jgi:hypothetical protein
MEFLSIDKRIKHHSVSDWNFSTADWSLDTGIYQSPPSSIKLYRTDWLCYALLKHSVSGAIYEGRIVDWLRVDQGRYTTRVPTYMFRNQTADGGANYANGYNISFYGSSASGGSPVDRVSFRKGAAEIANAALAQSLAKQTWYKLRITWWVSSGILMVRVEYWNGSEWVKECDDFNDPSNSWPDTGIGRVGVGQISGYMPNTTWHDDTEVWVRSA